ncbi:MAG: hypothetical protein ACREBH_03455 [Candidatus Micrarchaeaceae archaeon]
MEVLKEKASKRLLLRLEDFRSRKEQISPKEQSKIKRAIRSDAINAKDDLRSICSYLLNMSELIRCDRGIIEFRTEFIKFEKAMKYACGQGGLLEDNKRSESLLKALEIMSKDEESYSKLKKRAAGTIEGLAVLMRGNTPGLDKALDEINNEFGKPGCKYNNRRITVIQ